MRRKFIYIANIVALLFTTVMQQSCTHHSISIEDEIMMGALSVSTKAIVKDKKDLVTQAWNGGENSTGFGVFGYKKNADNYLRLFNNVEVKPNSGAENTTWSYTPIRYWDSNPNVSYQFIAYWPHIAAEEGGGSIYVTESERLLTIHNIPNWQPSETGMDIMTSARTGKYRSQNDDALFSSGMVPFTFNHRLALIGFTGYYIGIEERTVKITNITLSKVDTDFLSPTGKVTYSEPYGGQSGATGFTGVTKGSADMVLFNDAVNGVVTLGSDQFLDETEPGDTYDPAEICTWLTVPSDGWSNLDLAITFSIRGSAEQTNHIRLTVSSGTTVGGYSYIFKLKFDTAGGGITVEKIFVKDWSNPIEVSKPVYNW